MPAAVAEKSRIYVRDLPDEVESLIWEMQAQALAPLVAAGKLGCMLFWFPHWFTAQRDHLNQFLYLYSEDLYSEDREVSVVARSRNQNFSVISNR